MLHGRDLAKRALIGDDNCSLPKEALYVQAHRQRQLRQPGRIEHRLRSPRVLERIAQTQAAEINVVAVAPAANGHLVLYPADLPVVRTMVTVIQGLGNNDNFLEIGVIEGAASAELRNLQTKSVGSVSQP